jgi:hypothetical protein
MKRRVAVQVVVALIITAGVAVNAPAASASSTSHRLRFRSPQSAMRYLASAYNRHDDRALRHVTNSDAREGLQAMRRIAVNLRLDNCQIESSGMASCVFTHDYLPAAGPTPTPGAATMRVAPARRPGWVAKGEVGCG